MKIATLDSVWETPSGRLWLINNLKLNWKQVLFLVPFLHSVSFPVEMTVNPKTFQLIYPEHWRYRGHICFECEKLCNQRCYYAS